jgi:hypothetical protein
MEEGKDFSGGNSKVEREEVFSKAVRAGKRTYFFDVKATRQDDYYVTITESKKRFNKDGGFFYEKHKVFLYKEDFDKFQDGLEEVLSFIKEAKQGESIQQPQEEEELNLLNDKDFTDIDFDDLEVGVVNEEVTKEEIR